MTIAEIIAKALGLRLKQVSNTIELLQTGATIPFISRYRKEATGGLNEVQVTEVKEQNDKLEELVHRREYVLKTIEEQGKLTDELRNRIEQCWDATQLEDLYLPFKPKRRTRAEVARKKGLEPLANLLLLNPMAQPEKQAERFVTGEVENVDAALQGARDILAERFNEDERTRQTVRRSFEISGVIHSKVVKGKEAEAVKFRDYFDWSEPLRRCTSHRLLAMRRGEAEGFLRVSISPADEDDCLRRMERPFVKTGTPAAPQVEMALADAYKRLLKPSIETEFAAAGKLKADDEAIRWNTTTSWPSLLNTKKRWCRFSPSVPPEYTAAALTPQRTICSRLPAMAASWVWTSVSSTSCCRMNPAPRSISVWVISCRSGGTARLTS